MRSIESAVVFGATGATGLYVARELLRRGAAVRVVARDRRRLAAYFDQTSADIRAFDANDPDEAARAADDCDTIFSGIGLPVKQFESHLPITRSLLHATRGGARLVLLMNYWGVAPAADAISQNTSGRPTTHVSRTLVEQERMVRDAGGCVVMLPDLYGPELRASFLNDAVGVILSRRALIIPSRPRVNREFVFAPDIGAPVVDLASRDEAFGERWILGASGVTTLAELFARCAAQAEVRLKLRRAGRMAMRVAGLFNSDVRQYTPLHRIYNAPATFDDAATRRLIGDWPRTNYDEGLRQTIAWLKSRRDETGI